MLIDILSEFRLGKNLEKSPPPRRYRFCFMSVATQLNSAPVIILVAPQLAENIGMVARAMANFGLSELRLVSPRGGWPKKGARSAASGASHVLDGAVLFDTAQEAVADLNIVFATTARERGQMKRVYGPELNLEDFSVKPVVK